MKLRSKIVFLTDADSQSGQAIANRLADEGAHLILNSASGGQAIGQNLARWQAQGSRATIVSIDLCSSSAVRAALEQAADELGPIDALVHNNNLVLPALVESCEEAHFQRLMDANAKSAFMCTQAVGRQMVENKKNGAIVYVSSIHAEKPSGASFAYSAAKGAVKMLCREAAISLGRSGIRVNSIEMGPCQGDDALFASAVSALYEDYQSKVPNAELATWDDLANLALFLCSDEARSINGADIRLDGGFLMHYLDYKMKLT